MNLNELYVTLTDSTVLTSGMPTDGPLLTLMLNVLENLTTSGVMLWDVTQWHYIAEVYLLPLAVVVVVVVSRSSSKNNNIGSYSIISSICIHCRAMVTAVKLYQCYCAGDEVCVC